MERELTQVRPSLSIFRQEFSHFLCFFGEGYFVAPDCGGLYSNVFECMNVKNTTIGVNKNHSEAVAEQQRNNNGTTTNKQTKKITFIVANSFTVCFSLANFSFNSSALSFFNCSLAANTLSSSSLSARPTAFAFIVFNCCLVSCSSRNLCW